MYININLLYKFKGAHSLNRDFIRFQKKYYLEVVLKDLFISLSISFIVASILIILDKLMVINWGVALYILIPLVLFISIFVSGWYIFKPKKEKVSRRIDQELNLNQKVETMIKFENQEGTLIELQREDTEETLKYAPTNAFKVRISPIIISAIVVGTLVLGSSVAVPSKRNKINPGDNPVEIVLSEKSLKYIEEIKAISEIISQSAMADDIKLGFTEELNGLIEKIKKDGSDNYGGYAFETINGVKKVLNKYNTNDDLYNSFIKSENNSFIELANNLKSCEVEPIKEGLTTIMKSLQGKNVASLIKYVINQINKVDASEIPDGDALYKYFTDLVEKLSALNAIDDVDYTTEIEEIFNIKSNDLRIAILTQRLNKNMATYINSELRRIFELPEEVEEEKDPNQEEEPGEEDKKDKDDDEDKKDEDVDKKGGAGTGEVIYGSDDELFDPDKGVVKYGDVVADYFANIFTEINEIEDEEEKQRLIELFNYYYEILYGNSSEEEGD